MQGDARERQPTEAQVVLLRAIAKSKGEFSRGHYLGPDRSIPKRFADALERNGWAVIEVRPSPSSGPDGRWAKLTEAGLIAAGFTRCEEGWERFDPGSGPRPENALRSSRRVVTVRTHLPRSRDRLDR